MAVALFLLDTRIKGIASIVELERLVVVDFTLARVLIEHLDSILLFFLRSFQLLLEYFINWVQLGLNLLVFWIEQHCRYEVPLGFR